jgi:hypothetical protein
MAFKKERMTDIKEKVALSEDLHQLAVFGVDIYKG